MMKRLAIVTTVLVLLAALTGCGGKTEEKAETTEGCEIAMISESADMDGDSFVKATWDSVKSFADQYDMAAKAYEPEEASKESYLASVKEASDDGAKFIVLAGSAFETTAYDVQTAYPDTDFLLVDGVPHDDSSNYATAANMVSVVFAEEEVGYMAGYAAVKEGYTRLGFLGGQEIPAVKRYGYGFVQGAAAAAAEAETKVEMNYRYAGTSGASEDVEKLAAQWYEGGTEVIFVSGGAMTDSVVKAAEKDGGKVIGADLDGGSLSETIIASATKGIDSAVETVLRSYEDGTFVGGTAFNYAAKNDGVMLEMGSSGFSDFSREDYRKMFNQLKNDKIQLKKDTGVDSVSELTGQWVTLKE